MIRHNLLLIYRNFKRFKNTFFINLIGLSTGLACSLLIYLWVKDEISVDKFHENNDRLYRAMEHRLKTGGIWTAESTPGLLASSLADEMPEVEYAASVTWQIDAIFTVGEKNIRAMGIYAGEAFYNMFSYNILKGDRQQLLADKNSVVISEALALRLFNNIDTALGKTIELNHKQQLTISGICASVPQNSTVQFDYVIPYEKYKENRDFLLSWGNTNVYTFVQLKQGVDVNAFNAKIVDYIKLKTENQITHRTLFLKGYAANYLYGKYENGVIVGGRITYVKLFSIIAIAIIVLACINFMNLSTAKASRRIKEVGIKKAVGASRSTLVLQYMGESFLMTFLSVLVAILLVDIFLGQFNLITGKHLTLQMDAELLYAIGGIVIVTGILAGSYPALYLSGFNPVSILKGKLKTATGEVWSRKGLVVFQFVISIVFIVSVIVVYKQIEFIQSQNLGYSKDNLVYFYRDGKLKEDNYLKTFLQQVRDIPGVVNASTSNHDLTGHNGGTYGVWWEGKDPDNKTEFENVTVGYDMIETMDVAMAEGRSFSESFGSDTSNIIFNQAAIDFMALQDPIGKTVMLWGRNMHIIGVVKDFNFESLHEKVKPLFFRFAPDDTYIIMVKLKADHLQQSLAQLQDLYTNFNEGFPFEYHFLDADYQSQYLAEQRVATLSKYFAALAILISCLGLFGLAAFTAERRLKEIGIRKVLGSSEFSIIYLLSLDFTKMVLVSIAIALPISYFMSKRWLDGFAFKVELQWWYFIAAGVMALIITWLTVGTQAVKAAAVNPAKCLKDE